VKPLLLPLTTPIYVSDIKWLLLLLLLLEQ
jgi:hypothetical protein